MHHSVTYVIALKTPKHIVISIYLTVMIIGFGLLISYFFYYHPIIEVQGVVVKNGEQLQMVLYLENSHVLYTAKLLYKKQPVDYKVIRIGKPYLVSGKTYTEVVIDINHLDYLLVENNVVVFNLYKDKTNFSSEFTKFIKKGLVQW